MNPNDLDWDIIKADQNYADACEQEQARKEQSKEKPTAIELTETDLADLGRLIERIALRQKVNIPEESNMLLDAFHSDMVKAIEQYVTKLNEVQ